MPVPGIDLVHIEFHPFRARYYQEVLRRLLLQKLFSDSSNRYLYLVLCWCGWNCCLYFCLLLYFRSIIIQSLIIYTLLLPYIRKRMHGYEARQGKKWEGRRRKSYMLLYSLCKYTRLHVQNEVNYSTYCILIFLSIICYPLSLLLL